MGARRVVLVKVQSGIEVLRFEGLWRVAGVEHGVSARGGGVSRGNFAGLNLGLHVGDREGDVLENRRRWAGALGTGLERVCWAEQVHGAGVAVVGEAQAGRGSWEHGDAMAGVDGLVTDRPGLWLAILVADCVPVLICDPRRGVVGAAHAGWRGTVGGVAGRTVEVMVEAFGCRPADLIAAIGPSIGPEDFEVGWDVAVRFRARYGEVGDGIVLGDEGDANVLGDAEGLGGGGRPRVDLWAANRLELQAAGLRPERIEVAGISTVRNLDRYYSYRAEGGRTGRFAAAIALDATIGAP